MRGKWILGAAGLLALVACGGKSATSGSYIIGGTITGLTASSVELINGNTTVVVSTGVTTWVFPGTFSASSSYSVTVEIQPAGELCEVTSGGNGATLTANVSDVVITCSVYGQWTWESGLNSVNGSGLYGTQGAAAASNLPGARYDSSSWTDSSGDLWLFGGKGYDSTGGLGSLNDLWQYSSSTGSWTWVSGGSGDNAAGVYGTLGTPAITNLPGARYSASSWTDASGNLWLFGGYGYDSTSTGYLNDLWEYSPTTKTWTWVSGVDGNNTSGVYGTLGVVSATNVPGARYAASTWTDASGNLWLFGGYGYDATGTLGTLNDLWEFTPSTGLWTWVGGGNGDNASGVYGTKATALASNQPGARQAASAWTDAAGGKLWLFGGYGYDATGGVGDLNDLWEYSVSSGEWTWISGGMGANATAVYGTQGTAAATNQPGARQGASAWIDSTGILWLFAGVGYDSTGNGTLDDLWQYRPTTGQWIWVSGDDSVNVGGAYGTQGAVSADTAPGSREGATAWIDASDKLWLFGGVGYAATGNGYLNDLWQFLPP